jgi:hypothetical protein
MFRTIKNLLEGRSPGWEKVRKTHLKDFPACAACGKVDKGNEVHHVIPFNLEPSKELDPANLLTLCERHHLVFGHFDNFANYNRNVVYSAHLHSIDKSSNCQPLRR